MKIIHKCFQAIKGLIILFLLPLLFSFSSMVFAQEVFLYDTQGRYAGFIDPSQDSIFLSTGEPVAYINKGTGGVYGYNGQFLGWYRDGTIWDSNGLVVGFVEANAPKTVQVTRVNNVKIVRKPIPTTVVPPTQTIVVERPPEFRNEFSPTPFSSIFVYPSGAEAVR